VSYLLDTNACIALINGKSASVRTRFEKVIDGGSQVFVSSVAAFELWYGVAKSARPEANAKAVETFFSGPVQLLAFERGDAERAGEVRAGLEKRRKPIGAYDVLMAGQALRHKMRLVTSNAREFGRVKGLDWEDWGKA
jgi:tRNA(fMet)-specific endonuclease VapC